MNLLSRTFTIPLAGVVLLLAVPAFGADSTAPLAPVAPPALTTELEKVYYAIGFNMASNLRKQGIQVDLDIVFRGMRDALDAGPNALSDEEIRIATQKYQTKVRQKRSPNIAKPPVVK